MFFEGDLPSLCVTCKYNVYQGICCKQVEERPKQLITLTSVIHSVTFFTLQSKKVLFSLFLIIEYPENS